MNRNKYLTAALLSLAAGAFLALSTTTSQAADVSGKWSWTRPGRNGGEPQKTTLTLKADGEKLTGSVTSPGRNGGEPVKTDISDGKVKGDDVSFNVVREFNGNKMTIKYSGKVEGDAIKGTMESERNGQAQSRKWEAKREK